MAPGIILTIYFLYNDINTFNKTLLFCYFILYISVKSNTSLTSYIILNWLILMIVLQINRDNIYGLVSLYINVAVVVVVDQEVLISNCRNAVFRSKIKDEKKNRQWILCGIQFKCVFCDEMLVSVLHSLSYFFCCSIEKYYYFRFCFFLCAAVADPMENCAFASLWGRLPHFGLQLLI